MKEDTKQFVLRPFLWVALVAALFLWALSWFVGEWVPKQEALWESARNEKKEAEKTKKREAEQKMFYNTFGVELPPPEAREMAQADVIKKLVEVGRQADIATQQVELIGSLWEKTPVTTKGVAKRLQIQNKYDEAEAEIKRTHANFRQTCRVARTGGFNEEARALYCP